MLMVKDSTRDLNRFLRMSSLNEFARGMVMRIVVTFMLHRGRMSCSQAGGAIRTEPVHRSQITRFLARTRRLQCAAAGAVARTGIHAGTLPVHHRCHAVWSVGQEDTEHLQHGKSQQTSSQKWTALRREKTCPTKLSQFHVRAADHSLGLSAAVSDSALHQRILQGQGTDASDHRGSGRRPDSITAATRGFGCGRAGRYGVRRESGARGLRRTELSVDISGEPRTCVRRPGGLPTKAAFAFEGLDESVAQDDQAACLNRKVRRLPAIVALAYGAEIEAASVLRASGETASAFGWPSAARFFRQ